MEIEEPRETGGQSLDILGATFFYAGGESNMPKFGKFFKNEYDRWGKVVRERGIKEGGG